MFVVMVRHWGSDFSTPFGPFDNDEDAQKFKEEMEVPGSRRSAQVEEVMEPF